MRVPEYYTYDYCKNLASKYKSRSEFHDNKSFAYKYSSKMGWLDDFFGKKTELTYEYCKEIASKFSSRIELLKSNASVYHTCLRKKWIDDFFGKQIINRSKGATIYSYEYCKEIANNAQNPSQMKLKYPRAYEISRRNNWLKDFFGSRRKLTYEYCKEIAGKYTSKQELNYNDKGVYCKSVKMGWINDFYNNNNIPILELEIVKFCLSNNICFEYHKRNFAWLKNKKNMELDFFFPDFNFAIECQGIQHFEERSFLGGVKSFEENIARDKKKNKLCLDNGLRLFYYTKIDYTKYNNSIYTKNNTYKSIEEISKLFK